MPGLLLRVSTIVLLLLSMDLSLHSESVSPVAPKVPEEPSVRPVVEGDKAKGGVPVLLVTARGGKMEGQLMVGTSDIDVPVLYDDLKKTVRVAIADVDSIDFLRWQGRELRKNEFAFHPVMIRITLHDGKVIESAGGVPALDRFTFREGDSERMVFSYFHDYRKKGRWVHSGETGTDYPERNPHGDTLVRIVFVKPAAFNPLEMLFKQK